MHGWGDGGTDRARTAQTGAALGIRPLVSVRDANPPMAEEERERGEGRELARGQVTRSDWLVGTTVLEDEDERVCGSRLGKVFHGVCPHTHTYMHTQRLGRAGMFAG